MKKICFAAVSLTLIVSLIAKAQAAELEFLYTFLQGTYQIIGRWPNTDESYSGKIVLKRKGDHFQVLRSVNGEEAEGIGRIATATADKIKILNVEFSQRGCDYMATYMINSDLDNYARLTGYLFIQNAETRRPGLEALFIDHPVLSGK